MKTLLAALLLLSLGLLAGSFAAAPFSPGDFELTSGELRAVEGATPASVSPGAPPVFGSDSPVFRMRSKAAGYGDVEVSLELLDKKLTEAGNAWDGVHVWLRYQNPAYLYAVSVNRRDDRVVVKKKIPGGDSYGGTYFDLCRTRSFAVPYGEWQRVSARAVDGDDGSVRITLTVDGKEVLEAVDDGSIGGAPIARPGRVGLRADNADFEFRSFSVRSLSSGGGSR